MTRAPEWTARVEAWRASGQSAQEYCAGREYSAKTLQWWSSRLRRKGLTAQSVPSAEPVRLARVVSAPPAAAAKANALVVQVGGARVEVPNGTDMATLAAVFAALAAASGSAR